MTERSLIFGAAQHRDLAAIRREIENESNACVAELINKKLSEIAESARSKRTGAAQYANTDPPSEPKEAVESGSEELVSINFDDIVPYLNEVPSE